MRVAVKIALSDGDRRLLEWWSRSPSVAVRLREQSRIELMAADGMTNKATRRGTGDGPEQGGASSLNLVDRFFSTLTQKQIPRDGLLFRERFREVPQGLHRDLQREPEASGLDEAGGRNSQEVGAGPAGTGCRRYMIRTLH